MTREEMLTAIIQRYGFEHPETIHFAKRMETATDAELHKAMELALEQPFDDEDEDE